MKQSLPYLIIAVASTCIVLIGTDAIIGGYAKDFDADEGVETTQKGEIKAYSMMLDRCISQVEESTRVEDSCMRRLTKCITVEQEHKQ